MTEGKRARGRPRQGPFSGGKKTFTTKITTQTLERLARSAKLSQMSISQKGEAAIIRGLDAEDDFERYLSEPLEVFKQRAISLMPDHARPADTDALRATFKMLIGKLADDLLWSVETLASSIAPAPLEAIGNAASPSASSKEVGSRAADAASSPKRTRRKIDI